MFLVQDQRNGSTKLVFTWASPRSVGYEGAVVEGVGLDYDMEAVHRWRDGEPCPEVSVGRDPREAKRYKVFKYDSERQAAGFERVPGTPLVFGSWKDYLKIFNAAELSEEDWFEQLDRYDDAARQRRQGQSPVTLTGKGRDDVAAWVARKHLIADSSIREIWYLPGQAPPEEIRLLELSDRIAVPESDTEAIDFGLDVEGAKFKLFVADINSEHLDKIKKDPSHLPSGWSLEGSMTWRRGA